MKKQILIILALFAVCSSANAQQQAPKYQRSSLHMILLKTDEPALENQEDFSDTILQAWKSYPFPDKYNQHNIEFVEANGGKPKGSMMELITKYQNLSESNLSLVEAKSLMENLKGKDYKQSLIDTTQVMLREQKIAQQLLEKWFSIQEDGSFSTDLLVQRSAYNATQGDVMAAASTVRGLEQISDYAEDLIGNTFVSFSKLAFYENEPIAKFTQDLALIIARFLPGPAQTAAATAANAAYDMTHLGYSAYTTTVLYRLVWNDSIKNVFYQTFENNKINKEKFYAIDFEFELIGVDRASSSTFDVKGGLASAIGIDGKQKPTESLIKQTIVRNLDKSFAGLQYSYDVFKPLAPIISTDPLLVDIGMKESIKDGDKFELLEAVHNPKTNKIEYQKVAELKVVKGKVWDNRYSLTDAAVSSTTENQGAENELKGTELTANKKASVGMLVRQITKKK